MKFYSILNPNPFNIRNGVATAVVYKADDILAPRGYLTDEDILGLASTGAITIVEEREHPLLDRYGRRVFKYVVN